MKVTAVIMAGGRGERFWPKSRGNYPKQFLSLTKDGETMIQKTVKRLLPMVAMEDVFVVTNVSYAALVKEQLPQLPEENILLEPCARNTAPVSVCCRCDSQKYGEAMMLVLPSDHLIRYEKCMWTPAAGSGSGRKGSESGDHRHYPHLSGDRLWLYQL
ncbi:MAG: sugar phosphate nucleotidyltransferase [Ruminococcus sp.]